jgi:hypothetical protein
MNQQLRPKWTTKRISRTIHSLDFDTGGKHKGVIQIAMLSDLHWDNPKCLLDVLKKDLDYCLENNIPVILNGDTFCLMQGAFDYRKMKSDIRPEHQANNYFDAIIETAVEWFSPYAHIIAVVGYGNHETSIIKRHETDMIQRFVSAMNVVNKSDIQIGGYGGWIIVRAYAQTTRIKYFHGSGGGGIVTKGNINLTRALQIYEGMDCFSMGHIHENLCRNDVRDTIRHDGKRIVQYQRQVHLMVTGTYKEEYKDGHGGWHIERGATVKHIGGRILDIHHASSQKNKVRNLTKKIDSRLFPH